MWTSFMDMHSGGGCKEDWEYIYIEAPEEDAKVIFTNRFGHDPENVTCDCCGDDYSILESETLEEATSFERNCRWDSTTESYVEEPRYKEPMYGRGPYGKYLTLEEYLQKDNILAITAT